MTNVKGLNMYLKIKNKVLVMITLLATIGMNLSAIQLVKNSQPNATIIIAPDSTKSAQLAALELQYHIQKITGACLPITDTVTKVNGIKILVGESQTTRDLGLNNSDFKNQEYLVKVKDNLIILMGKDKLDSGKVDYKNAKTFPNMFDEIGTCYAVYDFLEKLGVRWYLPTDVGITFTPSMDLNIDDVEVRRTPYMKYREVVNTPYSKNLITDSINSGKKIIPLSKRETDLFKLRQRLGGKRITINHSLYTYYKRFLESHPEWFAKGYEGKPPQLCYSNPDVLQQVVKDARDFFDGKVEASTVLSNVPRGFKSDVFPVFPMDNSSWCKCEACQTQLKKEPTHGKGQFSNNRASDYIFGFVNKVAKKLRKTHPDKYIGAGTYAQFCYPPEKIKLEPNIITAHCFHNRMIYAKHIQENDNIILDAWKKAYPNTPKIIWMYYCFPTLTATYQQFRCFPGFFANHVKNYMSRYSDAGVSGIFIEPSYMGRPSRNGILMDQLEIYINWKLADNPILDADVLFNEFFDRYYGKAAEPMRQFYLMVEKIFCNSRNYPVNTKHQNEEIAWTRLGTKDRMSKLSTYMDQAKRLADTEPFKQRVALFDKGVWQYMKKGREDYLEREAMMAPTMQQTTAPRLTNKESGNPLTLNWKDAGCISLRYDMKAKKIKRKLNAKLAHDGEYFYIMYEEKDVDPSKLYSKNLVWLNDEWESFFAKQRGKPYHQLGVDATGKWAAMEYEGTVNQKWEFKGKVISQLDPVTKTWKVYITVPLDNIVLNGIKPGEMLYFNVIRSSRCQYIGSWIPTFGGYHAPTRFGEVYLEK
jgi:hypothetical protein